ncbi:7-keto-8-aminopelargonate synthetase-like enzyme [Desulfocapsa sulfexigens DSM 10523]|uniref:7-keto-8-aminopelargonate synthetase-like enzyme n=1 Tax=Desulfocapsa sulfexigens (strain DSM 10523 / SB164P1) TaxID=1167006 RepID=M1PQ98_DESSD|nr:aminotransferase class I/II-fold pyridoxal phosphate-dependent enzyme [Desulfocapsa sulfexigens]AGF78561.1 7-keto-8-aminopelargonate synthetase-like enzyme [Desulfocapsa sulfexigens DSM 10523]
MNQKRNTSPLAFPPKTVWDVEGGKAAGVYTWFKEISEELENDWVLSDNNKMLMLGGYSYLGLNKHQQINQAAIDTIQKFGTGMSGSRFLAGSTKIHSRLESKIAALHQKEGAIVYTSGYLANVSTIACLLRKNDYIICDKMNHASMIDGGRYSSAKLMRYPHHDLSRLQKILAGIPDSSRKLVIIDAIFSMSGEPADLPQIIALCKRYNAYLMVDECHSMFVLGKTGGGICEYYNINPDDIDITMATLSKSIPAAGGYVVSSAKMINYLRHESRGFIYSIALSTTMAATALKGLEIFETERQKLVNRLNSNTKIFKETLHSLNIPAGKSVTSIVPIFVGNPMKAAVAAKICHEHGLYIHAVFPPVVPAGKAILRASITASHKKEDLIMAAKTIAAILTELEHMEMPDLSGFNM